MVTFSYVEDPPITVISKELVYEPAISLAAATVSSSSLLQELNATHIETKANIMAIIVLNFFILQIDLLKLLNYYDY